MQRIGRIIDNGSPASHRSPRRRPRLGAGVAARSLVAAGLLLLGLGAGCGGGDTPPGPQLATGELALRLVDWSGAPVSLGRVAAIAEAGDDTALYTDAGVLVYSSGSSLGSDGSLRSFRSAAAVPSLGIEGHWLVCADGEGRLHRLRNRTALEEVSARFALAGKPVNELVAIGGPLTAFALAAQIAVSDGNMLTVYETGDIGLHGLAGGSGRVAGLDSEGVAVFDSKTGALRRHQLRGALGVAIAPDGTLWTATDTRLYNEVGGQLVAAHVLSEDDPRRIRGLAGSARGVWVGFTDALGLIRESQLLVASLASAGPTTELPAGAALHGSPSGDVWVLADGVILRYGEEAGGGVDLMLWRDQMLPVFNRKCQSCHLPGGSARIDLSTYGTWVLRRTAIRQRVIDRLPTPMPPVTAGTLDEKDLAAVGSWVQRSP